MELLASLGRMLGIDSVWDAVHTVIRPLGGALIAVAAMAAAGYMVRMIRRGFRQETC